MEGQSSDAKASGTFIWVDIVNADARGWFTRAMYTQQISDKVPLINEYVHFVLTEEKEEHDLSRLLVAREVGLKETHRGMMVVDC